MTAVLGRPGSGTGATGADAQTAAQASRRGATGSVGSAGTSAGPVDAATAVKRSSFYAAMRLLPPPERAAMYQIYAYCRAVDDVADDGRPPAERIRALADWRRDIAALYAGRPPSHLRALADAVSRFGMRQADFEAVIDGVEMDVLANIQAPPMEVLDLYCERVASAVGRLSVRVFGLPEPQGAQLAHHLGRALQLTNILRDVDEDAMVDRLYLPAELLDGAGIPAGPIKARIAHPGIDAACRRLADRAHAHFVDAEAVLTPLPRRMTLAPRLMRDVYSRTLGLMLDRGWMPPRRPVKLSKPHLAWIVARAVLP